MKYIVVVNGTKLEVQVDKETVRVGDSEMPARLIVLADSPVHMMMVGDAVHRVVARPGEGRGQYTLWVDGHRFDVEALDERAHAIRDLAAKSAKATGPAPLIAPMPGMIVRVHVSEGDVVQPGQGLVVMEAMKMENELRATVAATVRRIHVAAGTAVEKGALLLEME
jgi:biotin carboxyl carrier protein